MKILRIKRKNCFYHLYKKPNYTWTFKVVDINENRAVYLSKDYRTKKDIIRTIKKLKLLGHESIVIYKTTLIK